MSRKALIALFVCACLLVSFVVYVVSETNLLSGDPDGTGDILPTPTPSPSPAPSSSPTPTPTASPSPTPTPTSSPSPTPVPTPTPSPTPPPGDITVNAEDHEDPADYVWDSAGVIDIELNGDSITVNATGVATVADSKVTITSARNYRITGSLTGGQVIVDTADKETVRLILNGVNIHCDTSSPIYIVDAKKVILVLQAGTENYVTDGTSYVLEADTDEPNAAIFSRSDLTIFGDGSLNVDGNYNDGITSKDGLIIKSGTITVSSVDDGVRGKDYLVVRGGNITLDAGGDGLKSDNDADATMGYVSVEAGVVTVVCGGDAVSAETDVIVTDGEINLTSGGGSNVVLGDGVSAKGLKASVIVIVDAGTFVIDSADDGVHSNMNITINGGSFVVSTGDDGFHADTYLEINGGDINITKCNEGIESAVITINGGDIHLTSSDDGINVAGDEEDPFVFEPQVTYSGHQFLYINGGYIYVDALGDGFDVNGGAVMTGGVVIVNGPIENINGALDSASFNITGGFLVAVGSSGMAEATSTSSTQRSVLVKFTTGTVWSQPRILSAGTLVHIQNSAGDDIVTFAPTKQYSSIAFSSPALTTGSYTVYYGGSSTGAVTDGLYTGGTYTPGTSYRTFTVSGMVTNVS